MKRTKLTIIVPCYNEQEVLLDTAHRLHILLDELKNTLWITQSSTLCLVCDGSHDKTWEIIKELADKIEHVHGIKLSRNFGHQNAILAGLFSSSCDVAITIDADLQDDPESIREMLAAHQGGADVVYGVRRYRSSDTFFKRQTAQVYYCLLARLGIKIIYNHADYRLLSARAIEALRCYPEQNIFLRGIVPQLGFNTTVVYYDRRAREAGETKYPLKKMIQFALDGITSLSVAPLRAITWFGLCVSLLSFSGGIWAIWERIVNGVGVPGWASTLVPIFFLGGLQLLSLGVIGEYIGKTFIESKSRPRYIIEEEIHRGSSTKNYRPPPF